MNKAYKLKKDIEQLKKMIDEKKKFKQLKGGLLTENDIKKKTVNQLRRIILDNKISRGISKLSKQRLIEIILNSQYFKNKSRASDFKQFEKSLIEEENKPKMPKGKRPELPKEKIIKEILNIPDAPPPPEPQIPDAPPPPAQQIPDAPPPPAPQIPDAPPPPAPPVKKENEKKQEETKEKHEETKEKHEENKEGFISYHDKDKKMIDTGHSIINIYCGGSNHPDFPIPQSLARQALNAQQMPLFQQQQLGQFLQQQQPVPIQGIPQQAIPQPIPHPSHENLKPVKKFPPVETTKPLEKIISTEPKKPKSEELAGELASIKRSSGFNKEFLADLASKLGARPPPQQ